MRICCYGSSSQKTPLRYLNDAAALGKIIAQRDHVCVNGAGKYGCMGAMNTACDEAGGRIVGVIHEMFLVDSAEFFDGASDSLKKSRHELLVAKGDDLQMRKRMLVDNSEAIVVLPGGPGTYDELWEMACQKNLGMYNCPIVCISSDGFYDNFKRALLRAEKDEVSVV